MSISDPDYTDLSERGVACRETSRLIFVPDLASVFSGACGRASGSKGVFGVSS